MATLDEERRGTSSIGTSVRARHIQSAADKAGGWKVVAPHHPRVRITEHPSTQYPKLIVAFSSAAASVLLHLFTVKVHLRMEVRARVSFDRPHRVSKKRMLRSELQQQELDVSFVKEPSIGVNLRTANSKFSVHTTRP